jgi:hypothetical protein
MGDMSEFVQCFYCRKLEKYKYLIRLGCCDLVCFECFDFIKEKAFKINQVLLTCPICYEVFQPSSCESSITFSNKKCKYHLNNKRFCTLVGFCKTCCCLICTLCIYDEQHINHDIETELENFTLVIIRFINEQIEILNKRKKVAEESLSYIIENYKAFLENLDFQKEKLKNNYDPTTLRTLTENNYIFNLKTKQKMKILQEQKDHLIFFIESCSMMSQELNIIYNQSDDFMFKLQRFNLYINKLNSLLAYNIDKEPLINN